MRRRRVILTLAFGQSVVSLLFNKILKINDHVVITHTTIDAKIGDQFRTSATAII